MNLRRNVRLVIAILGLLLSAACNLPQPTPALTPSGAPPSLPATMQPSPAPSQTAEAPQTPLPSPQSSPQASPPSSTQQPATPPCNMAAPGNPIDITIPDNTALQPGETFTKVWRLINAGTCTWTSDYALVWFSGPQMGAPVTIPLPGEVPPGRAVDLTVDMVAPLAPGTYQSFWKLRSPEGVLFGIGPGAGAPFWVKIVVVAQTSTNPTATPTITPPPTVAPTSSPTPTATPEPHHAGSVTLLPGDALEVDGGEVSSADALYLTLNTNHVLRPQDAATWGIYGRTPPSFEDCQETPHSTADIPLDSLPVGTYLCYQSSDGYHGYARLSALDTSTWSITIEFLTWAASE